MTDAQSAATIDSALPALAAALDPAAMADTLAGSIDDATRGTPMEAVREHVAWSPGERCIVTYRVRVAGGDAPWTAVTVTAGTGGLSHRLYTADPAMPGLRMAADGQAMGAWLTVRSGAPGPWRAEPVRYRSGSRCVLRYTAAQTAALYGKVFASGAPAAAARLSALGDALVAQPLGLSEELGLVLQRDAGERSLADLALDDARADRVLQEAGDLVARLHAAPGPQGPSAGVVRDVADAGAMASLVERVNHGASVTYARALRALSRGSMHAPRAVPSHGALRLEQVRNGAGTLRLIDLDSYCFAPPERDVANLLGYLRWRALRGALSVAAVDHAREAFLDGYSAAAGSRLDPQLMDVFEALTLLKIAARRCRALAVDQWPHLEALAAAALELARSAVAVAP